ncbi:GNAT family N-acetyltransferase [Paenibacillus sp. F6_3S_P_1C]|uniref:GNAT family N-acetyltransferase n=1 Tax=Paenibacillus vandeheii TaxID=3035917 RepID=A0ABT8JK71_9BACL|nr:GNAT family N-acetyltransferase [Paenibacillus vandeheii]MDN4604966.1 GNAT family N-acetyltransferase [Paenibacillus vandeheii]
MQELIFTKDYKNNETLRTSFFELATNTFGLSFKQWYQKGFWSERYIPFSFVEGDKVIANVSVNILELIINGEKKKAIQIGTVMTPPEYQRRGLSASLMDKVLEEYENKVDIMYLFANDTVLDFYPKFGFKSVEEHLFSMDFTPSQLEHTDIRKLDVSQEDDLRLIYKFASERLPVSQHFGTDYTHGIVMYYCLNVFSDDIYYLENENAIAIYKKESNHMDLFDMISLKEINIQDILTKIAGKDTEKITFHFTPDYKGVDIKSNISYDGLFVRTNGENLYPVHVKHPITSIA